MRLINDVLERPTISSFLDTKFFFDHFADMATITTSFVALAENLHLYGDVVQTREEDIEVQSLLIFIPFF